MDEGSHDAPETDDTTTDATGYVASLVYDGWWLLLTLALILFLLRAA